MEQEEVMKFLKETEDAQFLKRVKIWFIGD